MEKSTSTQTTTQLPIGMIKPEGATPCRIRPEMWYAANPSDDPDDQPSPTERAERVAFAETHCRTACPLKTRQLCAGTAYLNGEKFGTWGGVTLAGGSECKKDDLAIAQERLRLVGGLDRCPRCFDPIALITHDDQSMAAAMNAPIDVTAAKPHKFLIYCPTCQAQNDAKEQAEEQRKAEAANPGGAKTSTPAPVADINDWPPSTDPNVREFWALRQREGRDPSKKTARTEWLLIDPDGTIEGCYAWKLAARTFARTPQRFRAMIAEGWTVRQATIADRNWNRPQRPAETLEQRVISA